MVTTGDDVDVISADGPHVSAPVNAYRRASANSASALRRVDEVVRRPTYMAMSIHPSLVQ